MPELPEVETIQKGLLQIFESINTPIGNVHRSSQSLRFPWPRNFCKEISGQRIVNIYRRAKYLVFETSGQDFICHLGMTGNWRLDENRAITKRPHDHLFIELGHKKVLIYNDVRRFGFFDFVDAGHLELSRWFSHLGPEPLDSETFHAEYLFVNSRKKQTSVKSFIMDQRLVVGIGNIYASEVLFRSGLRPTGKAGRLSRESCQNLVRAIREVLSEAMAQGGTTIKDFRAAGGSKGYFQQKLMVYGRDEQECRVCGSGIRKKRIAGRSTFWCGRCQNR